MDADTATRFISSLTKSLQAVIHGCLDFEKDIELGGYVYVRVDSAERHDYVLSEKMLKSDLNSMTFHSNSFHALPQPSAESNKSSRERNESSANIAESTGKYGSSGRSHSRSDTESPMFSPTHSSFPSKASHPNSALGSTRNSNSFLQPPDLGGDHAGFQTSSKLPAPNSRSATITSSDGFISNNRTQSLTDFQTAFRNPPASLSSQQSSSSHNWNPSQNGSNSKLSTSHSLHQQQQGKAGILPDANDMEVVHIKTEEEDDVFNIPLQCQQGGSESDGLAVQGKASWLAMRMRQPFYFPYPRLARSQSWDRRMVASNPRFPFFSGESNTDTSSLTCKICGKGYRSRQGLLFHERAKHQNVFNVYCPVCGKGFQQTTHMYGHMATHTNVKNFQCEACGAKYAHKTSLQQHLRSGSCRASQINNSSAGLDLSTSQIFRDFSSCNMNASQQRSSSSHSQSQSPLETDIGQGHSEGGEVLIPKRSSGFSSSDLTSPNQFDTDFESGEQMDRFVDQRSGLNLANDDQRTGLNLTSGDNLMGPNVISSKHEARGLNIGTKEETGGMNLSSGAETGNHNISSGAEVGDLKSRDNEKGIIVENQSETQGLDMTKETQSFETSNLPENVSDDSLNRHDTGYEHDSDIPETVSLSLSADDE